MKKLFTLAMLLVLVLTVNAQETYRKSWDFTKWSATTVANLKAEAAKTSVASDGKSVTDNDALWSDCEKTSNCTTYPISQDNCYWQTGNSSGGIVLTANGENIAETEGLTFTNGSARNLAIAINYGDCSSISGAGFGPYHGGSYLWLGGSKKDYFVIPGVTPGTTIKMGVESHKLTDARGVELYIVASPKALTKGTKLNDPDGNAVAAPTEFTEQTWLLPEDIPATDLEKVNEDGTYNILVYNTNGCHIYYITVGDGDSPVVEDAKKVAYLTGASFSADDDIAYIMLDGNDKFDVTTVAISAEVTRDSLANFDAVVIAPTVGAAEAAIIKPYIAFLPIVNLSSAIYEPLGLGKAVSTETTDLTIKDASNAIFEGMEAISYDGFIDAVELGDYFAKDDTLALAGEAVAIHAHNAGRNAYYYIPGTNLSEDVYLNLIPQTVLAVAKTKRAITAVGKPSITFKQEDGQSIVTIAAANSKAIYYTLDGTDPTTASTLYTEPFTLTEATTVKAFAIGDGYLDSEIATNEVTIAVKAAKPTIAIAREAGKSTVTLNAAEGIDIYFNFTQSETQAEAQKYDAPIEMMEPSYITFFAVGENLLQSDATTEFVGIDGIDKTNIRWDILAHMDANKDDWSTVGSEESRSSKVNYFFGKNAQSMYTDEIESQEPVRDSLGNIIKSQLDPEMDSILTVYKKVEQIVVPNVSNTWKVTSYGQVMTWENPVPGKNVGVAGSNCPELAADHMPVNGTDGVTNYMLNFKGKKSGEPYNATIQTVEAYQGPFDIVVYFNNGSAGSYPKVDVEYSLDEKEWVKIDTLETRDVRLMKRNKLSYEGTDKVFIRLAHKGGNSAGQVFDIYLLNNGELSQNYNEEETGIQTVQPEGPVVRTEFFTLGGSRMNNAGRGIQIIRTTYANGTVVTKKVIR